MALRVTPGEGSVTFEWDAVEGAVSYYFQATNGTLPFTSPSRGATSATYPITAGQRYSGYLSAILFNPRRVIIVGSYDFGGSPPAAGPEAPTSLRASVTETTATLSWIASQGATFYELRLSTSQTWTRPGNVASYTFTGLMPATPYLLELRAGNGDGVSPTVSIGVTTDARRVIPVPPQGDVARSALADLRLEVTQADDTQLDVTGRLLEFSYRYGANVTDDANQPLRLRSEGYLHLENGDGHYTLARQRGWKRLALFAGKTRVLLAWVGDVKEGEDGKALLDVKGLASRGLQDKIPVEVGAGTANQSLAGYLAASGVPLKPVANVTLPKMTIAAGARYNGLVLTGSLESHFHNDVDRFLDEVGAFGSLLALEDPLVEQWNVHPMPPGGHDTRRAAALTLMNARLLDNVKTFNFPGWRRDAQRFRRLKTATVVVNQIWSINSQARYWKRRSKDNRYAIERSLADRFGSRYITHTGTPTVQDVSGHNNPGKSVVRVEYDKHRVVLVWMRSTKPQVYNSGGGVEANHPLWKWKIRISVILELTEGPDYSEETYLADGNASQLGLLPFPVIPIPVDGSDNTATEKAIHDILGRQQDWTGEVATLVLLLLEGDEAWLQRKAGDVVNVTAGPLRDRCLIAGVRMRLSRGKPLQLEWSLLRVSPLGSAGEMQDNTVTWLGAGVEWGAQLLTFGPDPAHEYGLYFGGDLLAFSYEDVHFGGDTLEPE